MKIAVVPFLIMLLFIGCLTDSGETLPDLTLLAANSIKSVTVSGRSVAFKVGCTLPQPCYTVVRTDHAIDGTDVSLTILGRRTTDDPCLEVLVNIDTEASIIVPSAGSYTFRFWRYDEKTIDTTLSIP